MLKILILEDEQKHLDILTAYLARYREEHPDFQYVLNVYDRGLSLLSEYNCGADLIFLDIRVPDMLGIDVAREIRKSDENVMIVFITSLAQYAIDGYSVDAFDYILKPIKYASFSAKLNRIRRILSYRDCKTILELRSKESTYRVPADTVTYIESSGHDIYVHVNGQTIKQWGTLGKFEEQLREAHFVRCDTSFLVNLKFVQGVQKDTALVNGKVIPISRARRRDFLTALAQYRGGTS